MKALVYHGEQDVRVEQVPDPTIMNPRDAIIKITRTAICGSDLHLYNNMIPLVKSGDVLGHEFMGEVVELGSAVGNLAIGDRVVVPFTIACGNCFFCQKSLTSLCDNSNPTATTATRLYGASGSGLFGYSHILGGYAGGQAEYVRVPFADVGPFKVPDGVSDDQALFLSDIFPTGYMAAENCAIEDGDTVAVWGAGPVGLFAIKSAFHLGAGRVISIDQVAERLDLARSIGAETLDFSSENPLTELMDRTGGRGPDCCIDAVGMEAHGMGPGSLYDKLKVNLGVATDRLNVLRQAIQTCRKGGTLSIPGVYGGVLDKLNFGAAFGKGLTFKMGQTHVHRYMPMLMELITSGTIDPTFLITHRGGLERAPQFYDTFSKRANGCIKCVMDPRLSEIPLQASAEKEEPIHA
jgi:threonine dehydrogenase-like Zn-dependent dehydrogenase